MKANNFDDALNIFDPEHPLQTKEELDEFFVKRKNSPLDELGLFLRKTKTVPKLLFTGHRGSGKSTELAKLTLYLQDEFFIVNYSIKNTMNLFDIKYVDVILSLATELVKSALDENLNLNQSLIQDIHDWFRKEVIQEVIVDTKGGANISATLNLFVTKLGSKISTESSTRTLVREKIEPRLSELLERVDLVIGEIERITRKKVLIIVEDLDKADLASAREIFCEHSMSLTQSSCRIIFTFPIALRHDNDFINIRHNFDEPYVLPNFKVVTHDGNPDETGKTELKQIIIHRLAPEARLMTPAAVDLLVTLSGGLPRELVTLTRRSCLLAMLKNRSQIDDQIVKQAGNRLSNDYRVLLTTAQLKVLKDVAETKRVENDAEYRDLLHNLSVLEYRNDTIWYDVHPVVSPYCRLRLISESTPAMGYVALAKLISVSFRPAKAA